MSDHIAFVGSTLPALYVTRLVDSGQVGRIVASSATLEPSYRLLAQHKPHLKISSLPVGLLRQVVELLRLLLFAKWTGREIFLFHESCWPRLDLLIWLVRPKGVFVPQANMLAFKRLSPEEARAVMHRKPLGRLWAGLMSRIFWIYRQPLDAQGNILYVPVIRGYPKSIRFLDDSLLSKTNREKSSRGEGDANAASKKTIMFMLGNDAADSGELESIYRALHAAAMALGYRVYCKEHPNQEARLYLLLDGVVNLEPTYPAELLHEQYDFSFVVGLGSTSLATIGNRAISILDLLKTMDAVAVSERKAYLSSFNDQIHFIANIEDFIRLLKASDSFSTMASPGHDLP
ncbi:MAG: hypothetical protein HQM00_00060 [Magnetococcales bacterium]|nr:hypothetical protein [Magnetococcales bacterium]